MTDIKLPMLARDLKPTDITVTRKKDNRMSLSFSASSDVALERWWGTEILSHDADAVRMGRIASGAAPLLFNHDWDDPVGMVEAGRLENGRLYVDTTLFDTDRAREVSAMVEGGLRNVSIGYEIHAMEEEPKQARYTATDWEPLEVSIVTVPADPGVGIGRTQDNEMKAVRITRAKSATAKTAKSEGVAKMAKEHDDQAVESADIQITREEAPKADKREKIDVAAYESRRKDAIRKLAKANNVPTEVEAHWVKTGASLEDVSDDLLRILEERGKQSSAPAMLGMEKKDVRRYSVLKMLRAMHSKDFTKAGLELEAHRAIMASRGMNPRSESSFFVPMDVQVRDMTSAGASGSNYLVSTDNLAGSFVELLRNESVVMQLGATRLSGLQGNVTIPRQTAASTAYWLADENTAITESQPTIGQITLTPKNVAALTEISHQLMQQSDPSAEQLVMTDLARVLALAADVAALRGAGSNGQPEGIINTSGVGTFDTDGTATYADILSAQTDVAAANALRPGCAYVADPASAALLMGRAVFNDDPIWAGSLLNGTMAGFPAISTNQMSANTMLFGWWPSLIMAEWGVLELMVNPYSDFTRGLTAIRAWYTMDVALRYPAAFTYDATVA